MRPSSGRLPWGSLEAFLLLQGLLPAVLFIPGISGVRTLIRMASYLLAMVYWWWVWRSPPVAGSGEDQPQGWGSPRPWLLVAGGWLLISILHPLANSPIAAAAEAALMISVMAPAFWSGRALTHGLGWPVHPELVSRRRERAIILLFLCEALSAAVGLGQVYAPSVFNPPVIPALELTEYAKDIYTYTTADGREIIRPCGLTDTPGAAGPAGAMTGLLGLAFALAPGRRGLLARLLAAGLAGLGAAVIYAAQVRSSLVVLLLCGLALTAMFLLQRDWRRAAFVIGGGLALVGGGLTLVLMTVGSEALTRFTELYEKNAVDLYYTDSSRGLFVQQAFDTFMWEYPLGAGPGRWGQAYAYFGDHSAAADLTHGSIWAEVQFNAWILDGGIPLLVVYLVALVLAMLGTWRLARSSAAGARAASTSASAAPVPAQVLLSRDGYWAAVIFALNIGVLALCFSYTPFVAPVGARFWLLWGLAHRDAPAVASGGGGIGVVGGLSAR